MAGIFAAARQANTIRAKHQAWPIKTADPMTTTDTHTHFFSLWRSVPPELGIKLVLLKLR